MRHASSHHQMTARRPRRGRAAAIAAGVLMAALAPASAALAAGGTTTGADLQTSGSASSGSPAAGAVYTYTFHVKNAGPDVATSVVFNDPLPSGTVYNYATANGATAPCAAIGDPSGGATASCNLGDIAKGGQSTVVVAVNAPNTASTYSDVGTATSSTTDPNPGNNSATVSVQVKVAAGGVNDTAPLPAIPCAALGSISAPVGYYLTWAAIWNTFTIRSCSSGAENVNVEVTETNVATGSVDYDLVYPFSLLSAQNSSVVLDNDFAPFDTTYNITMTATDATTGAVLSTGSVLATTPPPR